jgi:GT2 family glycosyltransferase
MIGAGEKLGDGRHLGQINKDQNKLPQYHFSIVIPTYERPRQLAACLDSLTRLDYPRDRFEVIVVDDGSKAPLKDVVGPFTDDLNLTLVTQSNAGPASARNAGAKRANGAFLAFTDDDCRPAPNWLKKLAFRLVDTPDHMIGGRTINALRGNIYTASSQLMTDAVYAYYNGDRLRPHFFACNNLAVPANLFRDLGGFDKGFPLAAAEDREFCERWLRHDYQMTYAPEAIVYHAHALTFRSFLKHHFKYGRGTRHFHQMRSQRGWRPLKIDVKFYIHLFSYSFVHVRGIRMLVFEALLVLSYMAYTLGFFCEKFKRGIKGGQLTRKECNNAPTPPVST